VTRFAFLHDILGDYRLIPGSSSANVGTHLQATLDVLNLHFAAVRPSSRLNRLLWRVRARRRKQVVYRQAARRYLELGEQPAASTHVRQALRLYPFAPKAWALLGVFIVNRGRPQPAGARPATRDGVKSWTS
jgi:Tfp pilus assembly protein PilF